jgi:hypothetical protein
MGAGAVIDSGKGRTVARRDGVGDDGSGAAKDSNASSESSSGANGRLFGGFIDDYWLMTQFFTVH